MVAKHEADVGRIHWLLSPHRDPNDDLRVRRKEEDGCAKLIKDGDAQHLGSAIAISIVYVGDSRDDLRRRDCLLRRFLDGGVFQIRRVFLHHGGKILRHNPVSCTDGADTAAVQPQSPVADRLHIASRVRDKEHGNSPGSQFVDLSEASLAEVDVPTQALIDDKDLRINMDGDSK